MEATTTIATWGNSEAIRIPQFLLRAVGLGKGDRVVLDINRDGNLEVRHARLDAHRRVVPSRRVTFDELFSSYEGGRLDNADAWEGDELTGAEREAWGL